MKDEKIEPAVTEPSRYKTGKVGYSYRVSDAVVRNAKAPQAIQDVAAKNKPSAFSAFFRYEKAREQEEEKANGNGNGNGHGKSKTPHSDYGNYLFGIGYEDPSDVDGVEPTNWTSYTSGRFGIRLFSRGVMGAGFFTVANRATGRLLSGYNHMAGFTEQKNALQLISKTFDTVLAPPLKMAARAIAPAGKEAEYGHRMVWFRDKANLGARIFDETGKSIATDGRSLGAEMSAITFDFAMASVGDAWGRNIAALADPNQKSSWYNKDGQFDGKAFTRSVAWSTWDIISLRQAEDWAAALPYVYQMRFQRQALNKLYPGFKLTADKALNGGAWQLNEHGQITSSYAKAGMIDLQMRFTGYNWYTLMYRDMYRKIADGINEYQEHGYQLPTFQIPDDPVHATMDAVGESFRYAAKSAIKATIYMMPSVPFFWVFRVPQSKYKGMGITIPTDGDRAKGGYVFLPDGKTEFTYPRIGPSFADEGIPGYTTLNGNETMRVGSPLRSQPFPNSDLKKGFYPFDRAHVRGALDAALNPFGEACYKGGELLNKGFKSMGIKNQRMFAHDFVNASASYTPYMFAKTEAALHWDREDANRVNHMDNAIYRFIDGVTSLNPGEIKAGFSDVRDLVIHPEINVAVKDLKQYDKRNHLSHGYGYGVGYAGTTSTISKSPDANAEQPSNKVAEVAREADRVATAETAQQKAEPNDAALQNSDTKWADKYHLTHDSKTPSNVTIH